MSDEHVPDGQVPRDAAFWRTYRAVQREGHQPPPGASEPDPEPVGVSIIPINQDRALALSNELRRDRHYAGSRDLRDLIDRAAVVLRSAVTLTDVAPFSSERAG